MCGSRDPPAIRCYSTTFLSVTRRLLFSPGELVREVQNGTSPLRRFLSLPGPASSQPMLTDWTKERLRSSLDRARRVRVRRDDLTENFLDNRDYPHYGKDGLDRWMAYQKN